MRKKTLTPVMSEIRKCGKQQMCDLAALLLLSPLLCVLPFFKVLMPGRGEGKGRHRFHSNSDPWFMEQPLLFIQGSSDNQNPAAT